MSAAVNRRSGTGNESDRKATESARRAGLVSSTSDDSDVESSDTSLTRQTKDSRRKSDESDRKGGVQLIPEKEGKRPLSAPRPNKTAMLRAHNSREAVKNSSVKNKTPNTVKSRTVKNSPPNNTGNGSGVAANHTSDSSPSARVWTPSTRSSTKSSTGDDNLGETGVSSVGNDDVTQEEIEEVFSSGPVHPLPESLQMKRDDTVNKTFVLGKAYLFYRFTFHCDRMVFLSFANPLVCLLSFINLLAHLFIHTIIHSFFHPFALSFFFGSFI